LPPLSSDRGVILVGGRSGVAASSIVALQAQTGWPIIADPISGMRELPGAVAAADAMLRADSFVAANVPEVIVRIGRPASSKILAQWSASVGAPIVQVGGPGVIDPERNVAAVGSIDELLVAAQPDPNPAWLEGWLAADEVAQRTIDDWLIESGELTEPAAARAIANHLPGNAELTVASSMPIRDLEWFGGRTARAHANRGANGIDGVVSTALGRALTGTTSFVLIGDLAFVHDSNALVGLMERDADLRIVVVDNDGGGIFSFLPQATALTSDRFEQLFGTPLGADVLALAAAHRIPTSTATTTADLIDQLGETGPWVCRVPSDRQRNVDVHNALHAAITNAVTTALTNAGENLRDG
jgi:2-succinyl-5-enolpyruvyl-6-hydroxy-3-cyclohexene-1-carboxylate synthase